jgi:hypothetical protein
MGRQEVRSVKCEVRMACSERVVTESMPPLKRTMTFMVNSWGGGAGCVGKDVPYEECGGCATIGFCVSAGGP